MKKHKKINPKDEKAAEKSALNLIKYRARSEQSDRKMQEERFDR